MWAPTRMIPALLAAIPMPVFAGARGRARRTSCLSNLRRLGSALLMYVADYDDTYPYDLKPRMPAGPGARPAYDGTKWDASPQPSYTGCRPLRAPVSQR